MFVRGGDDLENCVEVIAHGIIPLDSVVYGRSFEVDTMNNDLPKEAIHLRCNEIVLKKTKLWYEYICEGEQNGETKKGDPTENNGYDDTATIIVGV